MARPRYRSYRGARSGRFIVLAVTLVLLLALGYGVYWVAEHISMNADGTIRVNLPQFISPAPSPTEASPEPLEIIVLSPSPLPPTETVQPSPTLTPEPTPPPLRAVFVPQDALNDSARLAQIKSDAEALGLNTLVIDYKSDAGAVTSPESVQAARDALGEGFSYVARVSVFLDNTMTRQHSSWTIKHVSGVNWINDDGRWLNPYSALVVDYCVSVIAQAAESGFDAVLLDNVCFPWRGQLHRISYGSRQESSRYEAMDAFYDRLDALETDMLLYVTALYDTAITGQQDDAGQMLDTLQARFDGVFVLWTDPMEPPESGIIPMYLDVPDMLGGALNGSYMLTRPDGVYR